MTRTTTLVHALHIKFIIVALAFVACAYADVSELGYNYPHPAPVAPVAPVNVQQPKTTYIPPAPVAPVAPVQVQQPKNTYIPPAPVAPVQVSEPKIDYIPPAPVAPVAPVQVQQPSEEGYRYKTVRRVVYKHRA
ncbi:uncharacterized protein [Musca autumnalis]|uniref:uncharacterized protein n=1 Tax=Musca autumnalis TaxID=221902 RepID=UPI003CE707CF